MEFLKNKEFDENVNAYKKLPLKEKHKINYDEFKKILAVLTKLINDEEYKMLFNKELFDLNKNPNEDDYAECTYVYLKSIEEALAVYVEKQK